MRNKQIGPVFWDQYGLRTPYSGVFQYAEHLYSALEQLGQTPTIISSSSLCGAFSRAPKLQLSKHVGGAFARYKPLSALASTRAINMYMRGEQRTPPAILHGLSNINLPIVNLAPSNLRYVLTVHDLIPMIAGEGVSHAQYLQTKILLPLVLKRADRVIAISNWTKNTLIERFPRISGKIVVIRNGVPDLAPLPKRKMTGIVHTLTIARSEAYKRLELVGAIARLSKERMICTLVTDEDGRTTMQRLFPDLVSSGSLVLKVNVDPQQLKAVYEDADVYLHPSLFEGHALPAGEALSYGRPVVYCGGSGIDELCGTVVSKVLQPNSPPDEWLDAVIRTAESSHNPQWKADLESHFKSLGSWKDCGKAVKSIYDELLT